MTSNGTNRHRQFVQHIWFLYFITIMLPKMYSVVSSSV